MKNKKITVIADIAFAIVLSAIVFGVGYKIGTFLLNIDKIVAKAAK